VNLPPSTYAPPRLTPETVALVKHFEGCFLEAYRDPVGVLTIGYGHTTGVKRGMSVTADEAENLLMEDLDVAQADVRHYVKVALNDNEFGALVSLAFNIGESTFSHSTLVRKLNKGDRSGAAREFERFVKGHIHGRRVTLKGLVIRRKVERAFFEAPVGMLVRDGRMVLAGRIIPVEHASYDVAHMGPPLPPQHHNPSYPAYPLADTGEADAERGTKVRRAERRIARAALISVGAGAAAGAIPATNTPAARSLVETITQIWQEAGGPNTFPAETSWLRWVEAFRSSLSDIFKEGALTPFLNYAGQFIRSHEALIVFAVTVFVFLLRSGLGGLLTHHDREA
jgi:lysozyme